MTYAKLINEYTLEYAPIIKDGVVNYNNPYNYEQLLRDGYNKVEDIIEQPSHTTKIQYYIENSVIKNKLVLKTKEEIEKLRLLQYELFVDNYTIEYTRKEIMESFENEEEKENLKQLIKTLVEEINTNFPYPTEE